MNVQPVVLRQQRDLSQIIQDAFGLYLQHFGPLFSIAAVVIPLGIASAALQAVVDDSIGVTLALLGVTLLGAAVNLLAVAALIAALGAIDSGQPPEFSLAYDVAFARFWRLAGALLRAFVIVLLLLVTIVGIPWAIQRAIRWLFIEQAVILDDTDAKQALDRSAAAVIGRWWRTLGIAVVIAIIGAVPASLVALIFALTPVLVSGTVNTLVNAALLPFAVTAMTLLYRDLQVRKESDELASAA